MVDESEYSWLMELWQRQRMAGYKYHIGEQLDIVEAGRAHSTGGSE